MFNYWSVLIQGDKIFASTFPIKSNTNTKNRDLHYLMLVYNKTKKLYTISIVGGKNYESISEVILKVNYNEYYLPVFNDRAWLTSSQIIFNAIEDMKISNEFITISSFEDHTQAIDTYTLKGFTEAFKTLQEIISTR